MRLHQLTLTAFGPFGGTHTVDFDALSAAGLFLLHGATGAGKTSVLDAVCYALYGGVPGARQQPGGALRSQHADPDTRTAVVLDLTAGGRRLEITRSPDQLRPKARGTGLTRARAHAALREWDPAACTWTPLSRSHQEIGEEVGQLLGMSRDQFCQVVLLPQGDFARFLRAGAEDRARLLGRLFDTGRFAAVEEELARMRKSAQREVAEGDETLLALAHRMRQAAGDTPELGEGPPVADLGTVPAQRGRDGEPRPAAALAPGDPGLADAVLGWAALARAYARERRDAAGLALSAAEEEHETARTALAETRECARRQERYGTARERSAELAALAPEREAARQRLERARAAEAVTPALALRVSAHDGHLAAATAERDGRAALPAPYAQAAPARLAELEGELRQELGALDAARAAEHRAAELDAGLAALDREARADDDLLREAEEWLDGWESERAALRARIDATQDAATRAERLAGQLAPARERLDAARRRDRLEREAADAEAALLRAREDAAAAHEHWLGLKEARLRGIAAELAARLTAGEPCAVCGSPDHPDPARADTGHVDQAAESEALAAAQRGAEHRERASGELAALRESHAEAAAAAGPGSAGRLAAALDELESAHRTAHTEAAGAHQAREALDRAEHEHARRLAERQGAAERAAARASRREELQRQRAALAEQIAQARDGAGSVAERVAALERRVELLASAAAEARAAQTAARQLKEADAQLADAAFRAGFDTPEEAAAARLPEPEQRALRQRLERWRADEAAVEADLADPELTAAAARPPARVDAAEAAALRAEQRLRAASSARDAARARCAELDALGRRAADGARRLAPLRGGYERVARLAGLAAGTSAENERRMRLESYVLAARLEQVAAAASARLARMSQGRYTLVHSDERAGGRGRSGLGLHVVDAWTGAERDTATLSGGETFFASLALALGLADVVTDEAGGTRLETLFIDEGFGSLDEQALDEVLDVLDGLRERDRCVGIVSHVADLRQRIPAQLEVVKSRRGSRLLHRAGLSAG
ncbi:AAA family ATPase [Streptomyces boncukensis]|uniref:Nuclease SbcCD subunit C n=1 Tax=Streptomyces boncukensis TaxID=2711219 RepID=A0A6G4WSV4_9ACTN|nr:SMC family ATPase [Streptomyces boncukensis]NGO68359.1 SMC family ATPase [Streptomyces boncukensis]